MEIYQPFMFVGLGGTGGKVGAELERWLRRNLRGADGETPIGSDSRRYLAYELPACFQFVYADLDEREAHELRRQSAPPGDHARAVSRTARVATNLVPVQRSYPEVSQSLRIAAEREVRDWLPPADGEPNIAPLTLGAGQLPTIARAALFETMATSGGVEVAQRPVKSAINALATSADELTALGGARTNVCDVFVVFSVAGGTGTGIFYDYLHLIADAFRGSGIEILIHPLVVMPSAFPPGQGGGRPALLNAGRGLLDLARLVDDQNTRPADKAFRAAHSERDRGLSAAYPGPAHKVIRIDPSTVQTAYLFSETSGVGPADLRRSVVSFILSMAGVRNRSGGGGAEGPGVAQNFFINRGVARQSLAPSGVGSRSMSEAAVTSLSIPRGEILDMLAAHLLSLVIKASDHRGQSAENNEPLIHQFMAATGLSDLLNRPNHARAQAHQAAPGEARAEAMRTEVRHLSDMLRRQLVPKMAREFDPWTGLTALLTSPVPGQDPIDLLRAERVIFGRGEAGGTPQTGVAAPQTTVELVLLDRTSVGAVGDDPPTDEQQQNEWLRRKVRAAWHQAWLEQRPEWEPKLNQFRAALRGLTGALRRHRLDEDGAFAQRVADLFAERKVAPYFLPDLPRKPEDFYRRLAERLAHVLGTNNDPTHMLVKLVERGIWEKVVSDSRALEAERAVANLRRRIDDAIWGGTQNGAMIVPRLADLLAAASGLQVEVPDAERKRFRDKLNGLIPPGLLPQAAGDVKVLVTYPVGSNDRGAEAQVMLVEVPAAQTVPAAAAGSAAPLVPDGVTASPNGSVSGPTGGVSPLPTRIHDVETYLLGSLEGQIGRQPGAVDYEFSPTREESLTVVLIRTALGVTDVPEVRDVMSFWSAALRDQQQDDYLKWRQRLGYHYDWLLTTEQQRVNILQQLMIAMRNGQVDVLSGTVQKPLEIAFRVSSDSTDDVARLQLRLTPFGPTSPWGSLLHAYEESTLGGDELNRQRMYQSLMNVRPNETLTEDGFATEGAPIYKAFRSVAREEETWLTVLRDELRKKASGNASSTRLRRIESLLEFWQQTEPAAWTKEFAVPVDAGSSLKELDEGWGGLTKEALGGSRDG